MEREPDFAPVRGYGDSEGQPSTDVISLGLGPAAYVERGRACFVPEDCLGLPPPNRPFPDVERALMSCRVSEGSNQVANTLGRPRDWALCPQARKGRPAASTEAANDGQRLMEDTAGSPEGKMQVQDGAHTPGACQNAAPTCFPFQG